jgi:alanine racemase
MPERPPVDLDRIYRLRGAASPDKPSKKRRDGSGGAGGSGEEIQPRVVAEFDAKALQSNYHAIQALVPEQAMIPMVKANAYGHGAEWVGRLLVGLPNLAAFGVATLEEGVELRQALGVRSRRTRVIVFSGTVPWSDEKGQICEENGLTPVIGGDEDWGRFVRGDWPARLPYELKFNTGMNRLGMSPAMARQVVRSLKGKPPESHPAGVFTHLAISENAEDRLSQQQLERFIALKGEFHSAFPSTQFHLANSGGIWNQKHWGLKGLTDAVRPGLALYGVPPWADAPMRGLTPVMTYKASVIAVHQLKPGESVGYGAAYKVPSKPAEPAYVAILSAGYADGVIRSLSNRGYGWLGGKPTRFLGRVSMDLSAVAATSSTRVGEFVEVMGPRVDAWAQAKAADTIPYELLTSVSSRVQRRYG